MLTMLMRAQHLRGNMELIMAENCFFHWVTFYTFSKRHKRRIHVQKKVNQTPEFQEIDLGLSFVWHKYESITSDLKVNRA